MLIAGAPAFPAMTLTSTDLVSGDPIPSAHIYPRCGGRNISPQLSWSGAPSATKSFVLTMIDLDVKPSQWSHWIIVGIPPSALSLPRGAESLPRPARAVVTDFLAQHALDRASLTASVQASARWAVSPFQF
jgi:phosphatidylethanolamine-binding protein (PEBP) family uncharacterized protein